MLIYSRFLFTHTINTWRHTFLGDTGPIHVWPDPFSPCVWKGAGHETSLVLYIVCTLRAMPWPTWRSEVVRCYQVHLLWLKHWNLSLSRSRVRLRLHLYDWGAGIDVACRLCTHYIDDHYHIIHPMITMQLLGMWSSFHTHIKPLPVLCIRGSLRLAPNDIWSFLFIVCRYPS